MQFSSKNQNSIAVTRKLIKLIGAKVSGTGSENCLKDHPDYPSLLAMSDCLTGWKISNEAFRIDINKYSSDLLSFPFVAHLPEGSGKFILITSIKDHKVIYSDDEGDHITMSESDFLDQWNGVILNAAADEESVETGYKQQKANDYLKALRLPAFFIVLLAILFLTVVKVELSWTYITLLSLKLAGSGVCILLLMQNINSNNPFIQNLCSLGKKNDCNAILKSDAANITSWLSWSETGFFYFAGSPLLLLTEQSSLPLLALFNLLALPYTIYSITYQYRSKNWCLLCCSIQALLWLEFATTAIAYNEELLALPERISNLPLSVFYILVICFSFPVVTWAFLKPFLLEASQLNPLKQQLKDFKFNSDLFNQVLTSQQHYTISNELTPIVLGDPEARIVITMVSNPFCGPCATAHQTIDEWLKERDDLQLKVIFATANHDDDQRTKIARHVTALSLIEDTKMVAEALNDWYAKNNGRHKNWTEKYNSWAERYAINLNGETPLDISVSDEIMRTQKAWCDTSEIDFTPTILINGYKLPDYYRLEDIKYLLM